MRPEETGRTEETEDTLESSGSFTTGVSTAEGPTSLAPAKLTPQILQKGAVSSTSTAQTGHFFMIHN